MAIVKTARNIVPFKVRDTIGKLALVIATRNILALRLYLRLLYGQNPLPGIEPIREFGKRLYIWNGIIVPADGIGSFIEVFHDAVYDRVLGIQPGDTVLDIGAYVGMFTIKAAGAVGKGGRVIAFEPAESNYSYLVRNIGRHKDSTHYTGTRIDAMPCAIANYKGMGDLHLSSTSSSNVLTGDISSRSKGREAVVITTLDDWDLKPDFIKIDAEGWEVEVLEGAKETLKVTDRVAIATYHTRDDGEWKMAKVKEILEDAGFEVSQEYGLRGYTYARRKQSE